MPTWFERSYRASGLVASVFLGLWIVCHSAMANEVRFVANGKAYHFDRETPYNEKNWGAGINVLFDEGKPVQKFVTFNTFKDSGNHTANMIGGGIQRRFQFEALEIKGRVDAGLTAFVMSHESYRDGAPFLGVLPFISVGTEALAINFVYIPEFKSNTSPLLFMQFMFRLNSTY
ncbi:hypothetical protein [Aurantivibrio plasticivorans]